MPLIKNEIRMFCPFCENEINVYLLSIDRELEEDLSKGIIPERLRNIFENEGISFSENIAITKENEDKWEIIDKEKKNTYIVAKEVTIKDGELEKNLNKGIIPEKLKNDFITKGFPLPEKSIVRKKRDDKWVITDEEKRNTYIVRKENEKLNIYDGNIKVNCPSCEEEIPLRRAEAKCPCGHVNDVFIPEGTQVLETHYIDISCSKCDRKKRKDKKNQLGDIYWTKCDERPKEAAYFHFSEIETKCDKCGGKFHIRIIKGEKSACLLAGGKEECRGINQSILGGMANWCGEFFSKKCLTVQKKYFGGCTSLSPSLIKRFGELVFCILTGFLLGTAYPVIIFRIFTHYTILAPYSAPALQELISIPYRFFLGGLFSGGLYFSFLTLKEIVIVCGELETKLREDIKEGIFIPFFVFRKLFFLLLFVMILGRIISDEIGIYGLTIPNQEAWIRWVDNLAFLGFGILFALIIPVFAGFGILLYVFWTDSQTRYGSSLKSSFLDVVPSIEKLSEIAIHSIIFLASAVFLNDFVWNQFEQSTVLGQIYSGEAQEIIFLSRTLVIGVTIIMPLVLYFLYLGKLTNNLKAIELAKIDGKLKRLSTPDSISSENKEDIQREKETLLSDRNTVSRSLRWIVGVDYGSRMLLLLFIGLIYSKLFG